MQNGCKKVVRVESTTVLSLNAGHSTVLFVAAKVSELGDDALADGNVVSGKTNKISKTPSFERKYHSACHSEPLMTRGNGGVVYLAQRMTSR